MSGIVVASASADFVDRVQQAMDHSCVVLPLGPLPAEPVGLFAQLSDGSPPDVVVLDSGADIEQALDLAFRFDQQCPNISVVLVTDLYLEIGLEAMRVGVRDMLHPDMEGLDISLVLRRAVEAAESRAVQPEVSSGGAVGVSDTGVPVGRVITVVSASGGVGKTLVATNLAVGLARAAVHSTVLVDLDLQFGDVASGLDLDPDHTLPEALRGPASNDTMVLKTFLTLHETGLYVICGPKSPAAADSITGPEVGRLLELLATEFEYVVVDTCSGLSEHVLAAMDHTSDLVLVTRMDVPGVRGLRKELDALTELAMFHETRHLVLNFADRRGGLSASDVEATLGTAVDVTLPRSPAALESVNQGIPLLQGAGRDPLTQGLRGLVSRFAPAQSAARRRPGGRWHRGEVDPASEAAVASLPRRSRTQRFSVPSSGDAAARTGAVS